MRLRAGQKVCGTKIQLDQVVTLELKGDDLVNPRLSNYTVPYLKMLSTRVQPKENK